MGLILQVDGLQATAALLAAIWCGVVVWKSIDYIVVMRRQRAEREAGSTPDGEP
ncbi:MAG TPA: hypothetical protein VHG08_03060 [Longimicrobium sp.]|nr:hypothetical protein [Longimicrobium sp.]